MLLPFCYIYIDYYFFFVWSFFIAFGFYIYRARVRLSISVIIFCLQNREKKQNDSFSLQSNRGQILVANKLLAMGFMRLCENSTENSKPGFVFFEKGKLNKNQ